MRTILRTPIKPYSNKDLARIFECSTKTINRNIKSLRSKLGKRNGHKWDIDQVVMIFEHLGRPYELIELESTINTPIKQDCIQIKFFPSEVNNTDENKKVG